MAPVPTAVSGLFALTLALAVAPAVSAGPLDELTTDRWAKLREAERYQMNIAEKFYQDKKYKVAAAEYEKYLKLYPEGEGSAYAQLKWSHCQAFDRQLNTAIKDGYQTLLDYYPASPEAPIAALLIGRTYKQMGDLRAAKKGYAKAIADYPEHFATVMARYDLVEIAAKENDDATRAELLRQLTYDVKRTKATADECVRAARMLCQHHLAAGNFAEGLRALATTCNADDLPNLLMHNSYGRLPQTLQELAASKEEADLQKGQKLAAAAAAWLKERIAEAGPAPEKEPFAKRCWLAIAEVWGNAGDKVKQKEAYEQMIAAVGADDQILGRLAQWYKANDQRDQARATYATFADKLEGQNQTAWSFVEEKQYDKAVAIYRTLAGQDDQQVGKWLGAAAQAYRYAGKPDPAIAVYRELLTADADKASAWHWQIAETLYQFGRWKEAITAYRGTDQFPTNYYRMATAQRKLKQYDEAITLYRQIMAGYTSEAPQALLQIAYTQEEAERKEPAIKTFKQVCDRFPKNGEASRAHAHLNEKYKITVTLGGAKD